MPKILCSKLITMALLMALSPSIRSATLLGVYYGNQGWNMNQVRAMESWQGKRHAVVNLFTDWSYSTAVMDNLFIRQLPTIWQNGNVPMISWMPYTHGKNTPANVEVRIAKGLHDDYIEHWAEQLKIFLSGEDGIYNTRDDRRVYIRLAHEMNGNWFPWSAKNNSNNPVDFIYMWQHVVDIFDSKGLDFTHVQWVWCVNNRDVGNYRAEQYYPGHAFVDWVAIDGFNWGASQSWSHWRTPQQVFGRMLKRIRTISKKPVAITEFGSTSRTSAGNNVKTKSLWFRQFLSYALAQDIKLVCLFNTHKEVDWDSFGGFNGDSRYLYQKKLYKAYSSYRNGVADSRFISANQENPGLLTDAQFIGR